MVWHKSLVRPALLAVTVLLVNFSHAQEIRVPHGKPPMIDGQISPDEWDDAAKSDLPRVALLFAKQTADYVWLAFEFTQSQDGAMDLYLLADDHQVYDLHASAKLGERKLRNGAWPDWTWWNNTGWVSNVSRVDSFEQRSFLPTRVREYQIQRSRFPGKHWKFMIQVMTPAKPEWKTSSYPPNAVTTNSHGWMTLTLDK